MKRFFKRLFAPLKKKIKANQGFTLLEILVVLTIMGFLIAMVAPRLAGVSSGAVDQVCDSNQSRMVSMMSSFFEKTNRFPSKMTNLVVQNSATYELPTISDNDPDNGAETLALELNDRNKFKIHILDGDEATELKKLGIARLFNLNSYDHSAVLTTDQRPFMNEVTPDAAVGVAMVGMGWNGTAWVTEADERGWGEPDWIGRIAVGFGPENTLVTSGLIANAAHCPGGIQNADNVTYNDYIMILPRLQATIDRLDTDSDGTVSIAEATAAGFGAAADINALQVMAYNDEPSAPYVIATNTANLKNRTVNIATAQESWQYATMCPEGHKFPADDEEFWGINLDGDANID
jgi:prepilin-type N-terminal cleavage/methylation domain-containing protein